MSDERRLKKEPTLVFRPDLSNIPDPKSMEEEDFYSEADPDITIPWDILSDKRSELVRLYIYDNKSFKYIAEKLGLTNESAAKYYFYSSLNKLSEYAVMRRFLEENRHELTFHQIDVLEKVYFDNKSLAQVAKDMGISRQAVHKIKSKLVKEYNIKWQVFVKINKGKLNYNVPFIFKG